MNIEQDHILEKLVQYIDGTLSEKENLEIKHWIETNKEMETQYNQLKQADTLMNSNLDTIPSDRMTARFEHWLDHYETDIKKTKLKD
ncbi:MAG: hypothetical protein IPK94_20955 [Saprospiraceae bacterium]|nr:hypothetical protein [Saprospiraceae bacterium]